MSNEVACIIDFYGRHDLRERPRAFMGSTDEETRANIIAASPLTYFDSHTPPMLIAHGTADREVPVEVSRSLVQELRSRTIDYLYIEIAGAPHTFDLHPWQMNLEPAVIGFLEKHLGRPGEKGVRR
jgi:dipeptidyl aminopeptidase/acylaminoacyl peptidase